MAEDNDDKNPLLRQIREGKKLNKTAGPVEKSGNPVGKVVGAPSDVEKMFQGSKFKDMVARGRELDNTSSSDDSDSEWDEPAIDNNRRASMQARPMTPPQDAPKNASPAKTRSSTPGYGSDKENTPLGPMDITKDLTNVLQKRRAAWGSEEVDSNSVKSRIESKPSAKPVVSTQGPGKAMPAGATRSIPVPPPMPKPVAEAPEMPLPPPVVGKEYDLSFMYEGKAYPGIKDADAKRTYKLVDGALVETYTSKKRGLVTNHVDSDGALRSMRQLGLSSAEVNAIATELHLNKEQRAILGREATVDSVPEKMRAHFISEFKVLHKFIQANLALQNDMGLGSTKTVRYSQDVKDAGKPYPKTPRGGH